MNFSSLLTKLLLFLPLLLHVSVMVVEGLSVMAQNSVSGGAGITPSSNKALIKQVTRGGGRSPSQPDLIKDQDEMNWEEAADHPTTAEPGECRLIVLHITDVYTLQHLASFKTLVEETKKKNSKGGTKVVSVLTGDFLSPYLLSSVDRGRGMMNALGKIPIDYLTWGNHEADIDHRTVCKHVRNFCAGGGKWINSNMLDHEAMESQQEYDVIQLESSESADGGGGKNVRRVGLCAVLSNDPDLYSHFKPPGAFGGATITDPWEALRKYKDILEKDEKCDLVLPLQHLYVPDDYKTCRKFDFPVIMSGHDHHRVDEVVDGTRLLKPGMNAVYATVLEISWKDVTSSQPNIRARFVKCDDWEPDPVSDEENERAYDALIPLRNTELARVPSTFEPLSSGDARGSVCTMGKYICSLLRSSMNAKRRQRGKHAVDAVLLMGGNIRGNVQEYPKGSFFSLEALEAEIKEDEVVGIVPMPGWLLAKGIEATHAGEPIPGWMQYDQGVKQDFSQHPPKVTHVAGEPLDPDKVYRVATKVSDLTNGQSPPWTEYYSQRMEILPPKGAYSNIQSDLMSYFARNIWRKLWDVLTQQVKETCAIEGCNPDGCNPEIRLGLLDQTGDGTVSVEEIQRALRDLLHCSVDDREQSLAEFVHSYADTTGDGVLRLADLEAFCEERSVVDKEDDWRLSFPRTSLPNVQVEGASATATASTTSSKTVGATIVGSSDRQSSS